MKRSRPLRRRGPIRSRRVRALRAGRSEQDPAYVLRVKSLPCIVRTLPGHACQGPIEAHHQGRRGMGQKAHDHTCVPLCMLGHREYHSHTGPFAKMHQLERRAWAVAAITATQEALAIAPIPFIEKATEA